MTKLTNADALKIGNKKNHETLVAEAIMRLGGDRYLTRGEVGILRTRWMNHPGSHDFLLKTYGPKPFKGLI